jgi:hypothetical protein
MGQLGAVLALIEQVPEQLITLDGPEYTNLTASIAAVRIILKKWVANDRRSLSPIPGLSSLNPVVVLHHAYALPSMQQDAAARLARLLHS